MKKEFKPSTYYSLPENIKVHNNFLEILEDCINESTLTSEQKQETSTVLYKYFCDDSVNKGDKICVIGKNGCEKIINLDLNDDEMMKFSQSAEAVRRMNLALKSN